MIARTLINTQIKPLTLDNSASHALSEMHKYHTQHLPLVEGEVFLGLIDEYNLIDISKSDKLLKDLSLDLILTSVNENAHVFEVIRAINDNQLTAMPILSDKQSYSGLITLSNLLTYLATANSVQEVGGIITLEMPASSYVLSDIARIVETNNARILNVFVTQPTAESSHIEVTMKINTPDLAAIIQTFERYEYTIKEMFEENEYSVDLQDHYDSFMRYLNV